MRTDSALADPRVAAVAAAVRNGHRVRLDARSGAPLEIHPLALTHDQDGWAVLDGRTMTSIPIRNWKDINITSLPF
jgi:hypothetical protein